MEQGLGALDYGILVIYMFALAGIGWWAARKSTKNTEDYFLASRSIPWLVTTASFLATIISALTFIASPGEGFSSDMKYLFSNIGDVSASFFIATCFLPVFQKHNVTSIYQVIEMRLGSAVRTACSGYFLISRIIASAVRIVVVAKVVEVISDHQLSFNTSVIGTVVVILSYTVMGGGRAVAWTDTLQFFLLMGGAFTALGFICQKVPGGFWGVVQVGRDAHKFNFLEVFDGDNFGTLLLMATWAFFQSSAAYGCDQDMAQRLLACNNPKKARWSLMVSGLAGVPIAFLFLFIGVGLFAFSKVDPSFLKGMTDTDQVFPLFIIRVMPPGLRGLLLAAVASAAMGSADSALASLATAFTLDFYRPFFGKGQSEERTVMISKISYVCFGVLFVLLAMAIHRMDNLLWLAFRIVGFTYGPLLGVFLVAMMTEWVVQPALLLAMMFSYTTVAAVFGIYANFAVKAGSTAALWVHLDKKWPLFVVVGALFVFFGSAVLRTRTTYSES